MQDAINVCSLEGRDASNVYNLEGRDGINYRLFPRDGTNLRPRFGGIRFEYKS